MHESVRIFAESSSCGCQAHGIMRICVALFEAPDTIRTDSFTSTREGWRYPRHAPCSTRVRSRSRGGAAAGNLNRSVQQRPRIRLAPARLHVASRLMPRELQEVLAGAGSAEPCGSAYPVPALREWASCFAAGSIVAALQSVSDGV